MASPHFPPRVAALTAALTLVAAACGGDDADDADAPATTVAEDAPATTEAPEPETTDAPEPETTDAPEPEAGPNLIDVATEAGDFTVLVAAVDAAGLTEELSTRERTVLAPTDDAFEALGRETIDALLADPDTLRGVLLNHVLPLPQTAADLALFNNVLAVGGASWAIDAGEPFRIGDATVIAADVEAGNGFIHVIDTVLLEPEGEEEGEG